MEGAKKERGTCNRAKRNPGTWWGSAPEYNLANGGPRQENDQKPGHRLKGGAPDDCSKAESQTRRRFRSASRRVVLRMVPILKGAQAGVLKAQPKAKFISHLSQRDNVDYCIPFWQAMLAAEVQLDDPGLSYFLSSAIEPAQRLGTPMNHIERYIAIKMEPKAIRAVERHRPVDIEEVRRNRCLTPNGDRFFLDAVVCYLARRTQEGDELVAKSRAFVELAHATSEREKYDYTPGHSEGCRSAVLSYVRWLTDGTSSPDLMETARMNLSAYYSRMRSLDRNAATIAVPVLLYTESYTLIRKIAERVSIGTEPDRRRKPTGLYGHAL